MLNSGPFSMQFALLKGKEKTDRQDLHYTIGVSFFITKPIGIKFGISMVTFFKILSTTEILWDEILDFWK